MLASMRGHAKTVSCLCAARAEIGYANGAGWDALWVAANDGRSEVVDVLLDAGAGDLAGRRDNQGVTPLMAASQSGQTGTMHILLEYELNARARRRALDPIGTRASIRTSTRGTARTTTASD